MLERNINCPTTSSTGRWFDAAAGALGLSVRQDHEAQAAMALEQCATEWLQQEGIPTVSHGLKIHDLASLDIRPLLVRLLDTPAQGVPAAALWFHLALADWAALAAHRTQTRTVCLGGGCFANQLLTNRVTAGLQARGLRVCLPQQHSCGDAGLALGQAWVVSRAINATNLIAGNAYSTGASGQFDSILRSENESLSCA
jgi:hydrogenase maturation protein HypF